MPTYRASLADTQTTDSQPPGHLTDAELREEVMRAAVRLEAQAESERAKEGRRVLGMRQVQQQR